MGVLKFKKPDGFHSPERYGTENIPPEIESILRRMEGFLESFGDKIVVEEITRRREVYRTYDFKNLCNSIKSSDIKDWLLYQSLYRALIEEIRSRT